MSTTKTLPLVAAKGAADATGGDFIGGL